MIETKIEIECLEEGIDFNLFIKWTNFEYICEELLKIYISPITQVLEDSKLDKNEIDGVILIGGSSRIPKIQEIVKKYFQGKILNKMVNFD